MPEPSRQRSMGARLCRADAALLDDLIASAAVDVEPGGAPSEATGQTGEERVARVRDLMALIARCPASLPADDVVCRTLARVEQAKRSHVLAERTCVGGWGVGCFRWTDMFAAAAVIVLGLSVVWVMSEGTRMHARRLACANHLAQSGVAIGRYAAEHGGRMPRVRPGTVWWDVGKGPDADGGFESNSAHLFQLVRGHYLSHQAMACPDNPQAPRHLDTTRHDWPSAHAVSYSYQNQHTAGANLLKRFNDMAILADKNPLFEPPFGHDQRFVFRRDLSPGSPTNFHHRRGQNILSTSGQVRWATSPIGPNGDNIWLIRGVDRYNGNETPSERDDSFLVP